MKNLNERLRINKSYQSLRGVDAVTDPKTFKLVRSIVMPTFSIPAGGDHVEMEITCQRIWGGFRFYIVCVRVHPLPSFERGCRPL